MSYQNHAYGIDFDGTVVRHAYPAVGEDVPHAVNTLRALVARGDALILWTMRSGDKLQDAVDWFKGHGIDLYGVQRNPDQDSWTTSPKAYCHVYIDDAALGCPLIEVEGERPYVDWAEVARRLGLPAPEEPKPRHTVERIKALRRDHDHHDSQDPDGSHPWPIYCTDCGWHNISEREGSPCDFQRIRGRCPGTFRAPEPSAPCGECGGSGEVPIKGRVCFDEPGGEVFPLVDDCPSCSLEAPR